ncbi:MAG: hypothetical protein A3F84_28385 [Candidatus Handelsmanbacteria bacterium RIFCSPLOWO2_12_FULL_64_10]|uniref:histidine kinase n=1 Tax=Handelsmanbacteria sp. (strain RIFCSPLOWO2_12_FULL_64_10) TaxID=1817868 RepID=A0A1F6CD02_HANXR|nr:MAG: hypothetical protein A3F84_28385 [Candidatus Handelsmanbacteria bacterium RIFCSPLOWO2_12_FULL_64_10]
MSEFEAAYEAKVAPILKKHGLAESSERGRATPDSVFNRLFEMKTPAEVEEKRKAINGDATYNAVIRDLGRIFGTSVSDGTIKRMFAIYTTPSGPGRVTPSGPGKVTPAGPGKGHWRAYDVTDGLASAYVRSIFQDREGRLWFATVGGVSRYDGRSFTTLTVKDGLAHNHVWFIFQDREGGLWFCTYEGVSRYDGKTWTTFTTKDGLPSNYVGSILQDREGNLWFGTQGGGVSRYDGRTFTTFTTKDGLAHQTVSSILQDKKGILWFGTPGGGVSRYDGKTFTTLTTRDGLASNGVSSILQDREGVLWFGTNGGVSRYDPSTKLRTGGKTWTTFTVKDGLAHNVVHSILQDREGVLWFGTYEGVSRYDGKTFTTFTTRDGLHSSNIVSSICQDREGFLWFGTLSGVSRYDGSTFITFQDGLPINYVYSICQDREGHLWFGTNGGGVSRYDREGRQSGGLSGMGTFTTFTTQNGLASNRVSEIFQDREGHLWFGTNGGVSRYDGKTFTTFTTEDGLASNNVTSIIQDREGHLWFGVFGGVSRYDARTWTTFTTQDGLASSHLAPTIFQDREGVFWFGTFDGGVSRYDGQKFTTFTTRDGLASNWVPSILQDREGHLWFSTFWGGVTRYDGKTFTPFTAEDGLASNCVVTNFQDREGHLWFGTEGGVSRYDGKTFQTLTRQDGLASNGAPSIFQDREGYLWFGFGVGVTRYRPPPPAPPPVFIDAVVADRRYEKVAELAIPSSVGLTVFEFHGISFKTRPEAMVYRYRLKGYDKDWRNTHARRAEYQNLPRGTYTFEVQAVDRDLVYSEKPAMVVLRVRMPYMLIGLWSALGVAIGLVAWQTVRVLRRDRRLQEANTALSSANKELFEANLQVEQANEAKSAFLANMSHEIRTPLNSVINFSALILEGVYGDVSEDMKDAVQEIDKNGEALLTLINDILDLSKIEAGRMELQLSQCSPEGMIDTAVSLLERRAQEKGLQVIRQVDGDLPLVMADERRITQHVLVNLVKNAIKFTHEGEVRVGARQEDGHILFWVSDTGIGIPLEEQERIFEVFQQVDGSITREVEGTGLGLAIAKRFVEMHGGRIWVDSEEGKGSTFWFTIPKRNAGDRRQETE